MNLVWQQWALVCLFTLSAVSAILMIGRPREPTTPGVALVSVALASIMIMIVVSIQVG